MENTLEMPVGNQRSELPLIEYIPLDKLKVRFANKSCEVPLTPEREIVVGHNIVSESDKGIAEMAADEPSAAGDQEPHISSDQRVPLSRQQAIYWAMTCMIA